MQIREIVLYGPGVKDKRSLFFNLNSINIITGGSKTGKTALIDIIDYCLGNKDSEIPKGKYFDTVQWYGLILSFDNEYVFVGRKAPSKEISFNNFFIDRGIEESPDVTPTRGNADRTTLINVLNENLGIIPTKSLGNSDESFVINVRHALYYSFQDEQDIISKKYLFHDQDHYFVNNHMKKTLPYFLNIIDKDDYNIRKDIENLNLRLDIINANIEETRFRLQNRIKDLELFYSESKYYNLIPEEYDFDSKDPDKNIEVLSTLIHEWKPLTFEINIPNENLEKVQKKIRDLKDKLDEKLLEKDSVNQFLRENNAYGQKLDEQHQRLNTINLFEHYLTSKQNKICPLCSNELNRNLPLLDELQEYMGSVTKNLRIVNDEKKIAYDKLEILEEELSSIYDDLRKEEEVFREAIHNKTESEYYDRNIKISKLLGSIQFWLTSAYSKNDLKNLKNKKIALKDLISNLESKISKEDYDSKVGSALGRINAKLNQYAKDLGLEHSENFLRFDMGKMTIVSDDGEKSTTLQEMGSSENFLGYHLITLFSFHEFFQANKSPTPRFLFLDQPSQPYYPKDKEGAVLDDQDRKSIISMYDYMFKMKDKLKRFQIIITDHADLDEEIFQKFVVYRWNDNEKLIPKEWAKE